MNSERCLRGVSVLMGLLLLSMVLAGPPAHGAGEPKILVLEIHGMKAGILADDLDALPNIRELVLGQDDSNAYVHIPRVLTTLPAASQPAVTSMYTGLTPRRTGVVASIWFDRRTARTHTLISYGQQRINRILEKNGVITLFDLFARAGRHSMTSMLMLTKGADWSLRSGAFFWGNSSVVAAVRNGRWIPHAGYVDRKTVQGFLTGHISAYRKSLRGVFRRKGIIPDLMAIQLLGMDLHSHYPVPEPEESNLAMDSIQRFHARLVLDPLVGELVQALKELGCYEDTVFVFVSEHGFSRIRKKLPDTIFDQALRNDFRLPGWKTARRDADAVIMPGAGTKEVYLRNRESSSWMVPPRLREDVKPALDLLLGDAEILDATEAILVSQYPGERADGIAETDGWWVFDWRRYRESTRDGETFLSCLLPLNALESQFELGDYLATGLRNQYTRWTLPDIKVVTRKGVYFENDADKYAHHGSFYPDDCMVSFWLAGPGLNSVIPGRHVIRETASTLDLVPMLAHLAHIAPPEGIDGRNPLRDLSVLDAPDAP